MTEEERDQLLETMQAALEPILDQRMDGLNRRIDKLDQRMGGLEQQIGVLNQRTGGLEQQVGELNQRTGGLERQIGELNQRTGGLERQVSDLDRRVISISDDILQPFISIAGKQHQELVERVDRLEETVSKIRIDIHQFERGPIRRLGEDVHEVRTRLSAIEQLLVERGVPEDALETGERWVTWSEYRDLELRIRALEEQAASYNIQSGENQ